MLCIYVYRYLILLCLIKIENCRCLENFIVYIMLWVNKLVLLLVDMFLILLFFIGKIMKIFDKFLKLLILVKEKFKVDVFKRMMCVFKNEIK